MKETLKNKLSLKSYETLLAKTQTEIDELKSEQSLSGQKLGLLHNKKQTLLSQIQNLKTVKIKGKSLIFSEHALLIYLQRVCTVDLDKIKQEILSDKSLIQYKLLGNGTYPEEGYKVVIRDGTVVTVK